MQRYLAKEECLPALSEAAKLGAEYERLVDSLDGWEMRELACRRIIERGISDATKKIFFQHLPTAHAVWEALKKHLVDYILRRHYLYHE